MVFEKESFKDFKDLNFKKSHCSPTYPTHHDINKLEYTLPDDTATKFSAFLSKWCLKRFSAILVEFFIVVGRGFIRSFFFIWQQVFNYFNYLFEKGRDPSFEQTWTPLPKNAFCQVLLNLAKWLFWRRCKCEKFSTATTTTSPTTDSGKMLIKVLTLTFGSSDLKNYEIWYHHWF